MGHELHPQHRLQHDSRDYQSELRGKVVVITGASSGFGKGAAREFARAGASLVLAARRDELLDDLVDECEVLGGKALAVPTDVSSEYEVEQLSWQAIAIFGRIDVWINNAGVGAVGRFENIPLADHAQVIATDLLGTLFGSYFAYRQFLKQGAGTLINIASEVGETSVPYYTSYTAAKHGVVGLSTSLRQEVMQNESVKDSVHICVVMPTAYDTPFFDHVANYSGHEIVALPPLHDPSEVVNAIVKLAANPKDKKVVGSDGYLALLKHTIMPGHMDKKAAKDMHREQMDQAPLAPPTPGAVRQPIRKGQEVSGGRRVNPRHH